MRRTARMGALVTVLLLGMLPAVASAAQLSEIIVTDVKDSGTEKTTFVDQPAKIYVQFRLVDA